MTDDELRAARQEISRQGRERAYELLLVKGLYNTIDCGDEVGQAAEAKLRRAELGTFDCYCKGCGKETPFIVKGLKVHVAGGGASAWRRAFITAINVWSSCSVSARPNNLYVLLSENRK